MVDFASRARKLQHPSDHCSSLRARYRRSVDYISGPWSACLALLMVPGLSSGLLGVPHPLPGSSSQPLAHHNLREVLQKVRPPVGARVLVAITKGAKLTDPHWSRIRLVLFHDEAPVFAQLVMQSLVGIW